MDDREKTKKLLYPGLAVAALVILVVGVIIIGGGQGDSLALSDGTKPGDPDNRLKPLSDGLMYRDIKVGDGPEVQPNFKNVTVYYSGWLTDGTPFDSNLRPRVPMTTRLDGVIDGWKKGIPGMKPGGVRKLVIPANLAYGAQGQGKIPPNATLVFEVELVESMPADAASTAGAKLSDGTAPGDKDEGLKDLGDGLKFRDLKVGEGPEATAQTRSVTVHYSGWLTDGTLFDSSKTTGQPATLGLGSVIKGWQRGIPGMKPGGVRKLVIPGDLAYGPAGRGEKIPPNATLVFEIELIR